MKFIILTILSTIIMFFVWNILKRIFFQQFYNHFPHQQRKNEENNQYDKKKKNSKENLNWDAETVEYEEIKDKQ